MLYFKSAKCLKSDSTFIVVGIAFKIFQNYVKSKLHRPGIEPGA
jgi:hypothetical protein